MERLLSFLNLSDACKIRRVCKEWERLIPISKIIEIFMPYFNFERTRFIKSFSSINDEMISRKTELDVILKNNYFGNCTMWKKIKSNNIIICYEKNNTHNYDEYEIKKTGETYQLPQCLENLVPIGNYFVKFDGTGFKLDENGSIVEKIRFQSGRLYHSYRFLFIDSSFTCVFPNLLFYLDRKGKLKTNIIDTRKTLVFNNLWTLEKNSHERRITFNDKQKSFSVVYKKLMYHPQTKVMVFVDNDNRAHVYHPKDNKFSTIIFRNDVHLVGLYNRIIIYEPTEKRKKIFSVDVIKESIDSFYFDPETLFF